MGSANIPGPASFTLPFIELKWEHYFSALALFKQCIMPIFCILAVIGKFSFPGSRYLLLTDACSHFLISHLDKNCRRSLTPFPPSTSWDTSHVPGGYRTSLKKQCVLCMRSEEMDVKQQKIKSGFPQ